MLRSFYEKKQRNQFCLFSVVKEPMSSEVHGRKKKKNSILLTHIPNTMTERKENQKWINYKISSYGRLFLIK